MKAEEKYLLRHYKHEANEAKSALIRLATLTREVSNREAEKLERIIGKLEAWQNAE